MNYADFLQKIADTGNKSEKTLRLWHHIYVWISEKGYADTADSPEFIDYVTGFRKIGVSSIGKHLKCMSDAGIISRHTLRRRLPKDIREDLLNPVVTLFLGGNNLPSTFVRYSLPGQSCPRDFKSIERSITSINNRISEVFNKNNA